MSTELETKLKEITRKMLPHVYPSWLLEDLTECIALASIPQQDVGEQPYNYRWDDPDWIVDGPLGRIFLSSERDCIKERERLNAAFAAGRSVPSEYVMSKDYEALYDHLLKGGEALGWAKYKRIPSWWPQTIAVHVFMINKSSFIAKGTNEGLSFPTCESLIAACTRLSLEWLAVPSPVGRAPVACLAQDGCAREKARRIGMTTFPVECTCVPSPVGQAPVACLAQDGCAREKARRIGMTTFPVECTCVPSPVGQAQQDSDVLGDAEGGPRAAGVPFAEDGGTGSSLAAPSPAIATEARQMMRGRADRAYCNYIDQMRRDECLGESAKFSTGKFGPKELAAHRNAAELLGAHKALYAILNEFPETPHPSKAGVLTEADAIAWMESKGMMWKGLAISTRDVTDHQLITMPDLLVRYVRDLNPEQ